MHNRTVTELGVTIKLPPCLHYCGVGPGSDNDNGSEPRGLDDCPFRLTTRRVCHICTLPIFRDESWEHDSMSPLHCRCKHGRIGRPEWMDRLECLSDDEQGRVRLPAGKQNRPA